MSINPTQNGLFRWLKKSKVRSSPELPETKTLQDSKKYYSCQNLTTQEESPHLSRSDSTNSLASQYSSVSKFSWTENKEKIRDFRRSSALNLRENKPHPTIQRNQSVPHININFKRSDPKRLSTKKLRERRTGVQSWTAGDFSMFEAPVEQMEPLQEQSPIPPDRTNFNRIEKLKASEPKVGRANTFGRNSIAMKKGKSMWHEEYPETYDKIKTNKLEVERQSIIHEIAQSHRDFYDDLQHVKAVYVRGLTLFGGLDVATVNSLFGNLEEVISVNDGLEEEYNSLRDESGFVHSIGRALQNWVPKISCYADYAKGLVMKRPKLEECFQKPEVVKFLDVARSASFARKLSLWSFLDAPRSNLPRLKLQLERLCKKTPSDNLDKKVLPEVISELNKQIMSLNDSIAAAEFNYKVDMLIYRSKYGNADSTAPMNATKLCHFGDVKYRNRDSAEMLLFDTCLVVAKSKGKSRLEVIFVAPLDEVTLTQPDNFEPRLTLTRSTSTKKFPISTAVHSDAKIWTEKVKKAKSDLEMANNQKMPEVSFIEPRYRNPTIIELENIENNNMPEYVDPPPVLRPRLQSIEKTENLASRPLSAGTWWPFNKQKDKSETSPSFRRKTHDGTDNKIAIENALKETESNLQKSATCLTNNSVESLPHSLTVPSSESSSNCDLDLDHQNGSSSIYRSPSSVSGTSFESSESDGFGKLDQKHVQVPPPRTKHSRSVIYQKPKTDFCEDEPDSEPLMKYSLQATLEAKKIPQEIETEIYEHRELEQRLSILSEKSDEMNDPESDYHSPESFDSGHPNSPTRNHEDICDMKDYLDCKFDHDGELHDLHTPRSITLSDMGSEIDVDQSLNLRGLYCYKYNDCMETASEIVINAISGAKDIINHQSQLNNSDSGTDSFSEQMEEELDALASHLVGKAIGLVHTELTLRPIP